MAKKRLKIKDKQGNVVDFDISSASVTIDAEGKSLDVKLSELVAAIASAVKSVTFNGQQRGIDSNGNVNLGQQMRANWNESNPNYPTFIENKPTVPSRTSQLQNDSGYITAGQVPSGVQVDEQMSSTSDNPVKNKVIKAYVDNLINGLLDGAPAALDTLKELSAALGNNADFASTITQQLSQLQPRLTQGTGISISGDAIGLSQSAQTSLGKADSAVQTIKVNGTAQTKMDGAVDIEVPTMTEISDAFDDAISEAQVSVVPSENVGIIDGMGSDSTTDALSANMGRAIKAAILTLWGSLGNYCFPAGRPTLVLDGSSTVEFSVSYVNTDQHIEFDDGEGDDAPESAELLGSITVHLSTDNNLYVINENSVKVYMNGVEVAGAYDPTTDTITVNNVTGDVVIVAEAMTYVGYGESNSPLVLMFDGKNQGDDVDKWEDAADGTKKLSLNGTYTKSADHVTFGGTDCYGVMAGQTTLVPYDSSTSEAVFSQADAIGTKTRCICMQGNAGSTMIGTTKSFQEPFATQQRKVVIACSVVGGTRPTNLTRSGFLDKLNANTANYDLLVGVNEVVSISHYGNAFSLNNNALELTYNPDHPNDASYDQLSNVMNVTAAGDPHNMNGEFYVGGIWGRQNSMLAPFYGNIYCVRLYSKVLSEAERTQNYKVDKKRFNIS